jgi:CRISPR-associated protein Csm5
MNPRPIKKIYRCCLQTVSPLHIGSDEVYEPTGFIVDASVPQLVAVSPLELIRSLSPDERRRFSEICSQGNVGSILEVYKFLRNRQVKGRPVAVCADFIAHYQKTMDISSRNERHVQQELNRFEIPRTAFRSMDGRPYIPGSSIKGALRTAYLNLMEKRKGLARQKRAYRGDTLQNALLDYRRIPEDPFRMVKVSDFQPVGDISTRIVYAVNEKKKVSERLARGQAILMEMVAPGATFIGEISVETPGPGAPIQSPITLESLLAGARDFFMREKKRENFELQAIGVRVEKLPLPQDVWLLRCGRHSGAESVTVEGHRSIRIMGKRGEKTQNLDHATTLWLASEHRIANDKVNLKPMGWAVVAPLTRDIAAQCDLAESSYQDKIAQLATESRTPAAKPVEKTEPEVVEAPARTNVPTAPKTETWSLANLTWDPGSGTLTASSDNGKATTRDKGLIPESIQQKLFKKGKKKPVRAKVEVAQLGNAYAIISIQD